MQTSIDNYGRVIIPKSIRDDLGLEAGSIFEIEANNHNIVLKAVAVEPHLKVEEGILVYTGKATENKKAHIIEP
jgi:AbrB family looped-hinge helix DNA binding protein